MEGQQLNEQQRELKNMLELPDPVQVCLVVRDLRKTAAFYEEMFGIGPFVFPIIEFDEITYHGKPAKGYWEMAFARIGEYELELSCPIESPSIYEDFLQEHGEGMHHFGFEITELDSYIERAERLGFPVMMSGRTLSGGFAHLDTRKLGGTILELIERPSRRV